LINREEWDSEDDLNLLELTIQHKKKWSLIAAEHFPHQTQHSIKNRVVSLLTNYSCEDRKEVHEILKNDYIPFVLKAIERIKKEQDSGKSRIKKDKIKKEEDIEVKCEKNNLMPKEIPNINENFAFNFSIEDLNYYNTLLQTHMNLYLSNRLAHLNFDRMLMLNSTIAMKLEGNFE